MLSDIDILKHKELGNIVIEPYLENLLNSNSYDVRLGEWFSRQQRAISPGPIRYNSNDGQDRMWDQPQKAEKYIDIYAGETILAHTLEFIGGRNIITTEMRAKSTTGRYALSVCKCAGLGDVGFISRWTMEMTNHSKFIIRIPIGEPVAQIIFDEVGPTERPYKGRYGQGTWYPTDMLPKVKRL